MTVYFVKWDTSLDLMTEANHLYDVAGTFDCVEKGDLIAIKLHVGELGNPYYVQPFFVHDIIRRVIEAGGKPFLTDANTYYEAQRNNAYDHMITALTNGFNQAPFIVADGLRSENYKKVKTKGILNEIEVAGVIAEADAMIVVSHDKGHELSGFGGAIKNLGMGCTSRDGKLRQHRKMELEIDESKCIGCGKCYDVCPYMPSRAVLASDKDYDDELKSRKCDLCANTPFHWDDAGGGPDGKQACVEVCPVGAIKFTKEIPQQIGDTGYKVDLRGPNWKKLGYPDD